MLNPSFTRGEYWLLETAVKMCIPVSPILLSQDLELAFNKSSHGMDANVLEATLTSLSARGLIDFHHSNPETCENHPASVTEIASGLAGESNTQNLYYGMSQEGGLHWEAFAHPKWDRFVDKLFSFDDDENESHCVSAANRQKLQRIFDGLHFIGLFPKPETVKWTDVSPWQATYWKILPAGYCVEFTSALSKSFSWDKMPRSYYKVFNPTWYGF